MSDLLETDGSLSVTRTPDVGPIAFNGRGVSASDGVLHSVLYRTCENSPGYSSLAYVWGYRSDFKLPFPTQKYPISEKTDPSGQLSLSITTEAYAEACSSLS